ncbi:MAG: glycosyltransferase family 39 protein [Nanoarchaeota archaeon]|nr:glycosyltransferase family 39 protein [Nanoarchaeota archaeon]
MTPKTLYYLFLTLWIYGLILYPVWLPFENISTRIIIFTLLLIITILGAYYLRRWTKQLPTITEKKENDPYLKVFLIISIIYFLIQLPLLAQDLPPLSDESFHISRGIWLVEPATTIAQHFNINFHVAWNILLGGILIIGMLTHKHWKKIFTNLPKKTYLLLYPLAYLYFFIINTTATAYHTLKFGTATLDHLNWLTYYGPISALLYGLEHASFGFSELGMRIIQPLFTIGTAYYLYRLLNLKINKPLSLTASILYLFSPIILYFAGLSYLEAGQLFFITASSYYFIKSIIEKNTQDTIISFLCLATGYMYKQPVLFLFPIFALYLLINHLQEKKYNILNLIKEQKNYLKGAIFALISIAPLLIINLLFDVRHTGDLGSFNQWLQPKAWTIYFSLIPKQTNILIFSFFILGIFASIYLLRKKDPTTPIITYFFTWFISWYLIHMSYIILLYRPIRITVPYIPAVIGISILPLYLVYKHHKKIAILLALALITFTIIHGTTLLYHNYQQRYVPIDDMFHYLQTLPPATILATTAPHPYEFYKDKYHLQHTINYDIWKPYEEQTAENLYIYMKTNNISYALFIVPKPNYYDFYPTDHSWIEYQDCAGRKTYQGKKEAVTLCPLNETIVQELADQKHQKLFATTHTSTNGKNHMILLKRL